MSTSDHDPRPSPPQPPAPGECCESGCDPCVLDTYAEELRHYREQLARWLERHPEAREEANGGGRPPAAT